MKNILLFIVAAAGVLVFPGLNYAQYPALGTTRNFVLYTNAGAVGNTARSQVTGDVGTGGGNISGFGNVNGVMRTAGAATIQATADLAAAYTDLNGRTANLSHDPAFVTETLVPGVYNVVGASTLSGDLTLSGAGMFIFKLDNGFNANAGSKIILTGGALACNVFWKIENDVNLLAGSSMKGTMITKAGAIGMSTGAVLEGRALSMLGPIALTAATAYTPLGCTTPVLYGPTPPNLGTTANFGLFTGIGTISNIGVTYVRGDVGSNSSAPDGFDPANVTGMIHLGSDDATVAAKSDIAPVYTYLNTLPADIELLFPADFGNGLVLTPHTYHLTGATVLDGTLFLNAQGNPDGVFVIQINGALSTVPAAKVVLINGAKANNVFWKVDGAVNVTANTEFVGTILVNNEAIKFGSNAVLSGRAMTNIGDINVESTTIADLDGTLPVTWVSFTGKAAGEKVLLEWITANELNNGFFTLQKSRDGRSFETFANVPAHSEQKNSQYHYSFTDLLPYSHGYYKISQTDNDGKKSTYKTIDVKVDINERFKGIYYVQQNYIYVKASGAVPANGMMKIYSLDGKLMSSQHILLTKDVSTYKSEKQLPKGIYVVQLESQGTRLFYKKVMVY